MTGCILLLVAPDSAAGQLFELMARLALQSSLLVVDGGNTFQGYMFARLLRRHTPDYEAVLRRVMLSRVFTCYQMAALLAEGEFGSQASAAPLLALDFLATFYDQGVRTADRRRLLKNCITHLQRLSRRSPVAVWVRQRSLVPPEGLEFLDRLRAAAGKVWVPHQAAVPTWRQGGLLDL